MPAKVEKACQKCSLINIVEPTEKKCHRCGGDLSGEFQGYLVVLDPKRSEIAKKMGINAPGKYALRVR